MDDKYIWVSRNRSEQYTRLSQLQTEFDPLIHCGFSPGNPASSHINDYLALTFVPTRDINKVDIFYQSL